MPNIDISRDAHDQRKHYDRVFMQQGRVITDDDFNEAERLDAEDARRVRVDVIGPAGSPDDGFRLKVTGGNLALSAGTFYVGGLRLEMENDEQFNLQKDWLQQGSAPNQTLTTPAGAQLDFVWLDVWQQPVTGVEDKELLEAALGGADTSARMRTMRRARVLRNVGDVDCATAWAQLLTTLAPLGTINGDFELVPNSKLKVEPDGTAGAADLCTPPVNGGYLGAENQAIRVQIVGANQFTWGYDNGAPIYRVKLMPDSGGAMRKIQMLTVPKDQAHYPLHDQVVELLPWSALLSNGQKNAEQSGFLSKVNGSYDPDTQELSITTAPPDDTGTPPKPFGQRWKDRSDAATIKNEPVPEDEYFYMRVWNRGGDTASAAAINFNPGVAVPLAKTGLKVTFSGPNLRKEDFWVIAARPQTPNVFVPWELSAGRSPHGVRHWIAPLGIIRWPGGAAPLTVEDDCRPTFLPLTRIKGCCTYSVGDGTHSFGNFSKIQNAIQALPLTGGQICVLPGIYNESVVIDKRINIRIHGCGPRSRVQAALINDAPAPAFMISNSNEISIETLAIESGPRSAVQIDNSKHVTISECLIQMRDQSTLWQAIYSRGDDILIQKNIVEILPREGGPPVPQLPPLFGAGPNAPATEETEPDPVFVGFATRGGIQLAGGSDRVSITDNIIRGGIWNGITLGSLHLVGSNEPDIPDKPSSKDPCDPCKPPDLTEDEDPNNPTVRFESAGDLYDIRITGNRITDMGINGIGVVRFFNLANGGDMIGVHGLYIADNLITRCMRRSLAQVIKNMLFFVAYGGIALAKVVDLRILRNEIVNNGSSHLQPICGVFAIFVEGLQLDDNRILENGPKTEEPVEAAQKGLRGGVHVWLALPVLEITTTWNNPKSQFSNPMRNSVPTCSMRDNVIIAPLGRAVTFFAVGQVVVARNRLVSLGYTQSGLDLIASTVLIGNLGLSNEWTLGLLVILILIILGKSKHMSPKTVCAFAKVLGILNPQPPPTFASPLVKYWATGKTLFTENQVTLDVMDQPFGIGVSSIFLFSLDDVGMTDNQCEISTSAVFFYVNALLLAGSVRESDNRLSETFMHAAFSAWSMGLMNTTTDNQTTHCLKADAILPKMLLFKDNLNLITAFGCDDCGDPIP